MADLVRRDPFAGLMPMGLRQVMDRLFEEAAFPGTPAFSNGTWDEGTLAVDISQQGQELVVRASVPGFKKEDIDVQVHEGVLSIKAQASHESESESESQGERYYRRERRTGSVSRRIALPGVVHDAPVTASLKDGVLTLKIAVPEAARPKQIEIASE